MQQQALIIIDPQNDYFDGGRYPLANTQPLLGKLLQLIDTAHQAGWPVVFVQHIVPKGPQPGPFFNEGSDGAAIHPQLLAAAPKATVITKHFADSFDDTDLQQQLQNLGVTGLLLCGMMTQNCVTHTALSPQAQNYQVKVIGDACTTREELLHLIALRALSRRTDVISSESLLA